MGAAPRLPGPRLPRRPPVGGIPPGPLRAGELPERDQTVRGSRPDLGPRVVSKPSTRRLWSHLSTSRHSRRRPGHLEWNVSYNLKGGWK